MRGTMGGGGGASLAPRHAYEARPWPMHMRVGKSQEDPIKRRCYSKTMLVLQQESKGAMEQGSKGAREQESKRAREQESKRAREQERKEGSH